MLTTKSPSQYSAHELRQSGERRAFLTVNQLDTWAFEGEVGETIIASASSEEFDPVLEIALVGSGEDKVLVEVDDQGNESRFSYRLTEKAKYKIRVHANKFQGGGNYILSLQRIRAEPLEIGKPVAGTLNQDGKKHFRFRGLKDQILIPNLVHAMSPSSKKPTRPWYITDTKGEPLSDWHGSVRLPDDGEHLLVLHGTPDYQFELVVREAQKRDIEKSLGGEEVLKQGEMDIWNFEAKPGDFRYVEIHKFGAIHSRIYRATENTKEEEVLEPADDSTDFVTLPAINREDHMFHAVVFRQAGRYEMQLLARSSVTYQLRMQDPSQVIQFDDAIQSSLSVGGAAFYRLQVVAGQIIQTGVSTDKFVPVLELFDSSGRKVQSTSEEDLRTDAGITYTVSRADRFLLKVSSLGGGGGGEFRLNVSKPKLRKLKVGERVQGTLQRGTPELWSFEGRQGQIVIAIVRSPSFAPVVSVRSPEGTPLLVDRQVGAGEAGTTFAIKLSTSGDYGVWISSTEGGGEYSLRLIGDE
ncbi:MAG: hypothetical protein ABL921_14215 [Pirellula sp.]